MQARIRERLAGRRRGDQGFTLIELLVVVIIIGILAAIAIPVFLNQKSKAYDASVKADLKSFSTNAETYFTDNNSYGAAVGAAPAVFGTTKSTGNTYYVYVYSSYPTGYIIYGKNANSSKVFYLSSFNGSSPTVSSATALPSTSTLPTETPAANGSVTLSALTYSVAM